MTHEILTVIVPCMNEEAGVRPTVQGVLAHADRLPVELRVLMIDDGSTDGTLAAMEALAAEHPHCSVISNGENIGMGRSVMNAYQHVAPGSWVTVVPGDNEFAFESIDAYLEVRDRYDLVLGYLQNPIIRTFARRFASWLFTRVVSLLYGFHWQYLNGMKMYRVEVFQGLEIVSSGHAFMAEMLGKAQLRRPHLRIGEVPFAARGRARGQSKAFRPGSVLRAVYDVYRGARSVSEYRSRVVLGEEE